MQGRLSNEEILKEIKQAEQMIEDRIADNMDTFGVSSTVGRLLGIIYMNRSAMTLDELADRTGMSKTRMSQVMRQMMTLNIAEKEFIKGSRKEHYTVEDDYARTFISLFTTNWKEVVSKNMTLERRLRDRIMKLEEPSDGTLTRETEERISALKKELDDWSAYYNWIQRLVDFFESGEIFEAVPVQEPGSDNKNQQGGTLND